MRAPTINIILRASTRLHLPRLPQRNLHVSPVTLSSTTTPLADGGGSGAKGRTGGGSALGSSSPNAPARPKVFNSNVSGSEPAKDLTEEQKEEVDEHNRQFAKKHDHGQTAPGDKVDEKFWKDGSKV
ncbi:hypothetical protein TOPH_05309 [Tolypocladium ophioglossoides CBS 100239]|uniref:Succinate dehydrogenase assembly factor 4, mitochondrial n=1 Tax=Tolypocladium ophioglossoides (strain CBS 100239) TaxID=1163406 RepID=A0A0L0N7J4_TOLOC|nr:hypothetical protein TOPH_05309 [Tolypocladium ophioglossoides CBS 100239]